MEKYRRNAHKRCWVMGSLLVFGVAFLAYNLLTLNGVNILEDNVESFRVGFSLGLMLCAFMKLRMLVQALRNPEQLEKLYVNDHDERRIAIRAKAGVPVMLYSSCLMFIAALVASYFNETVFVTLVIAGFAQVLLGFGLKLYYTKTM